MRKNTHSDPERTGGDAQRPIDAGLGHDRLPNRLMTAFEVAEFVGCHEETIRRAYLRGLLTSQRFGVRRTEVSSRRRAGLDPARCTNASLVTDERTKP